jgi:AcrR family transcriptional regulator
MRISQKAKKETDARIIKAAEELFLNKGYQGTTTRDIAAAAGIAAGTLFNYYRTKEALAMHMIAQAMKQGQEDFERRKTGEEEIGEEFFMIMAAELRRLSPYRSFVGPVLESGLSLFVKDTHSEIGQETRNQHLNKIEEIVNRHGYSEVPFEVAASLYWSLYLGILANWCQDDSEHQEETLALIDYTISLFTRSLNYDDSATKPDRNSARK